MNQTTQDAPEAKGPSETTNAPEVSDPPSARVHPRFTKPQRVAFVQSAWHREVIEQCRLAFLAEIEERNIERARIDLFEVPGSFEIPLHVQLLAKTRRYTAIVAAGLGGSGRDIPQTWNRAAVGWQRRTQVPGLCSGLAPPQVHANPAPFHCLRQQFS